MAPRRAQDAQPNIVVILADDLGYGDLGVYGSRIPTPNLDRMAQEGVRFEHFYSASPVCTPSRAALITGRYAARMGLNDVLFPEDDTGLPETESTIASALKPAGYSSMLIGKWHLGSKRKYLPVNCGFDEFYGVPFSNDMQPLPLMQNGETIESNTPNSLLTQRYTGRAVQALNDWRDRPFFLMLAHNMPHIPLGCSSRFKGRTGLGAYADAVAELDWSVGEILRALRELDLDHNTLMMFSSDNGPWYQGSPGRLRGRKGETYEGGMRVPFIARMPGRIEAGRVTSVTGSLLDILPTACQLAGAALPPRPMDGVSLWPLLAGEQEYLERPPLLYFTNRHAQAIRSGRFKLQVSRHNIPPWLPAPQEGRINLPLPKPELYDLERDPEESYDCSEEYPDVAAELRARLEEMVAGFPADVRNAWQETHSRRIEWTPAGARPSAQKP